MFWAKCGKILTDQSGAVVNCDVSPCGFYTVLGFKYRYLNQDTMQPHNKCAWYYDVQPFQVKDGKIQWNYDMCNVCINISQKAGLVAKKKFKKGCYTECYEWNEAGECIDQYEHCDCVMQVQIYNLAGCFDDFNKFAQFFYSKGNISPDSNGKYPEIWENWYGTEYPSDSAHQAIENYWNRYFCDRYMMNYKLNYTNHEQRYWQWVAYQDWETYTQCYCYNDEGSYSIGESESCSDGYQKQCYIMEDHPLSIGGYAYQESCNNAFTPMHQLYVKAGGYYGYSDDCYNKDYPCYLEDCCDYVASLNTTGETGAFIMEGSKIKQRYCDKGNSTHDCRNSNSMCTNWSYSASCFDNYYWDPTNARFHFGWSKVTCQRNDLTPDYAKGVKFEVTLKRTKKNTGRGNESSSTTEQKFQLSLMFDQVFEDLPLLDNINTLKVIDHGYKCNSDCEYEEYSGITTQPAVNWGGHEQNVLSDNMDVSFVAIEYIK